MFTLPIIGGMAIWRWSSWITRYALGRGYKPIESNHSEPVSVVTTSFNQDPEMLKICLQSVMANNPDELIVVLQEPENKTYEVCKYVCKSLDITPITTQKYGKREGLKEGILQAKNSIVCLIDDDVVWNPDVLSLSVRSFGDKSIGAVLVSTRALNTDKWHQKLMDLIWDMRNKVEFRFLAKFGIASVVSGRTAFYRKEILTSNLSGFIEETFLGAKVISGEDKFLTRELMKTDMKMSYQSDAIVKSDVPESLGTMLSQYMRWQRNSWRSDLKLVTSKTAYRRPILGLYMIDKMLGKFALPIGTVLALYALSVGYSEYLLAMLLGYWIVTRTMKAVVGTKTVSGISFVYVFWTIISSILSLVALATIRDVMWHTRNKE